MNYSKLIAIFAIVGCVACGKAENGSGGGEFEKTYKTFGGFTGKRIILTHGVWDTDALYDGGDFGNLKNGLIAKGFQVVTFTYPYSNASMFEDGGASYRAKYKEFLEWMIADLNYRFGVATELDIGGFSFGGLHAMIGAALIPSFNRYLAMLPVTDPYLYPGIFGPHRAESFNAFNEVVLLSTKLGLIVTSHDDSILGYQSAQTLASQVGATYADFNGVGGHNVNSNMVSAILAWF